ncbi:MAG TPA: carbamoyltransferase C-terminal domain-containing protein [Planctomycetota bacterium]|nr:carbamoyltransferase C-terminal domain-containing protein [Planctomycetota bacterium]
MRKTDGGARDVVLGVVDGLHDAGAAAVVEGRLVAAANEERFTRRKLQGGMPVKSVAAVLSTAGLRPSDVDVVAVGGVATPTVGTRLFRPAQAWFAPSLGICFDRPWHPVDRLGDLLRYRLGLSRERPDAGAGRIERALAPAVVARGLPRGLRGLPLCFVDHHLAHAESAWRTAGPGRWLVVTCDAHGDGRSLTVSVGEGAALRPVRSFGVACSVGAFYSLVTKRLGFVPGRDEGKVLGLSASGDASHVPAAFPFRWEGETLRYSGTWGLRSRETLAVLDGVSREDAAAWVQRGTEAILLDGVARWLEETATDRVALAGGVFANVLVNGRIAALPGVRAVHVFPHMGDGGLAAGAALHVADAVPRALGPVYLGPAPTDRECEAAVRSSGFRVTRPHDPDAALVEHLAAGRPVARCVGGMEFGPRALGHRSILCDAARPEASASLNVALQRDDFMPFAPILRAEEARDAFPGIDASAAATRFMTVALPASEAFRAACPAAVHVDGTARPQVVHREESPELHRLLTACRERTGRPALVNTSFNMHQEPIVASARDAVRSFAASGLPAMRLGPLVLERAGAPA